MVIFSHVKIWASEQIYVINMDFLGAKMQMSDIL